MNEWETFHFNPGRVGRTFKPQKESSVIDFDPDLLSYSIDEDPCRIPKKREEREEFTYNEVKDARWCFDTPGIVKENCVGTLWHCALGGQGPLCFCFCISEWCILWSLWRNCMSAHLLMHRSTVLLKQLHTSIIQRNLCYFSCATLQKKVELRRITSTVWPNQSFEKDLKHSHEASGSAVFC